MILLGEALFVFRPMHRALTDAVARLRRSLTLLGDSERRHARAMAGARDGFFDWKPETGELEISPRFREIWLVSPDAPIRWLDLLDRLAASDRGRLQEWLDDGGEREIDLEMRVQGETGWGWVRLRGAPSGDGFVSGRLSDIHDRRRLLADRDRLLAVRDAQLQDADEALERSAAMSAVATLAGGLAHDFNNYLQVIQLQAEWLESHHAEASGADASGAATAIRAAATEASALAGQLLTLAHGELGTTLEPVQVADVVNEMGPLLRGLVADFVTVAPIPTLPRIDADVGQLRQVLVNLVKNAAEAMPEGGQVRVEMRARERGEAAGVEVAVVDEGRGMKTETVRRAFEPFFTTKRPGKGTGLGLAMVHRIVERHGGNVFVESAVGRGTAVRMWFPARSEPGEHAEPLRTDVSMVLLLVDDDRGIRRALRRQLTQAGHRVHVAATGTEAVEVAGGLPDLDMLITDVMLPDILGPEVADQVRRQWGADLPVLFISGYAPEHVDLSTPRSRLLVKPFTSEALLDEIARNAPRRRAAAQ